MTPFVAGRFPDTVAPLCLECVSTLPGAVVTRCTQQSRVNIRTRAPERIQNGSIVLAGHELVAVKWCEILGRTFSFSPVD